MSKSCVQFNHIDHMNNTESEIQQLKVWYSHYHRLMKL